MKRLTQAERDMLATSCQSAQQLIDAVEAALAEKNKGKIFSWVETDGNGYINWDCAICISDDPTDFVNPMPVYTPPQPDRTAELEALLLWALYHHQGGSSEVGQPIRQALGIGQHDQLTTAQIQRAKQAALAAHKEGAS